MDKTIDESRLYAVLGERLKERRRNLQRTQEQLANRVGVVRTSITNIEAGLQKLPLHVLYQLCHALEIRIEEILPSVEDVTVDEMETVEVNGQSKQMPPKTASFVRVLADDLSREQ